MNAKLFAFGPRVALQLNVNPGWVRSEGETVIGQPKLGVTVRWVYWDSEGRFLYDQVLRAEKPGALFLPVCDGKVGLQKMWRPQARDMDRYEKEFPEFDLENLGRESWEVPRGFRISDTTVEETMRMEAEGETRGKMISHHPLPPVCDNTAFSPHLTYVSFGEIDLNTPTTEPEEPLERILSKLQFYTLDELTALEKEGTFYDGYTSAAIERLRRYNPQLLE